MRSGDRSRRIGHWSRRHRGGIGAGGGEPGQPERQLAAATARGFATAALFAAAALFATAAGAAIAAAMAALAGTCGSEKRSSMLQKLQCPQLIAAAVARSNRSSFRNRKKLHIRSSFRSRKTFRNRSSFRNRSCCSRSSCSQPQDFSQPQLFTSAASQPQQQLRNRKLFSQPQDCSQQLLQQLCALVATAIEQALRPQNRSQW